MSTVWFNYAKVLAFIMSNFALALCALWLLRTKLGLCPSERAHALITLSGTVLLLVAGLGKLGWSIQTFGGNTPPERLNDLLFKLFSYLGIFFIFLEWLWSYQKK